MGAGQIGGIATLWHLAVKSSDEGKVYVDWLNDFRSDMVPLDSEVDVDFQNAAGFLGEPTPLTEAQFVVHYLSHAMIFCVGAIIEAHVILTPASCVFAEKYKFQVVAGTHRFLEFAGIMRTVENICTHKGYNHTKRWQECSSDNMALLILKHQFSLHQHEPGADYPVNRVRYGIGAPSNEERIADTSCKFYGWGSRRNGYLIPLLINLQTMPTKVLRQEQCLEMWNFDHKYLCIKKPPCLSEKFGALCPDDLGSVLVCSGYLQGMMISRLVDRLCGVGYVDMQKYNKFLTCGVDDSRDVINHEEGYYISVVDTQATVVTPIMATIETTPTTMSWEEGTLATEPPGLESVEAEVVVEQEEPEPVVPEPPVPEPLEPEPTATETTAERPPAEVQGESPLRKPAVEIKEKYSSPNIFFTYKKKPSKKKKKTSKRPKTDSFRKTPSGAGSLETGPPGVEAWQPGLVPTRQAPLGEKP